jgi:hypothetical protein
MTNLNCKSIALTLGLISLGTHNLMASNWTQLNSSTLIVRQSSLTNDTIHHVGDLFGGGVVFFVDRTGQHGLICSLSDIVDLKSLQQFSKQDPTKLKGRKDSAVLINQVFAVRKIEHAEELCDNYTNSNHGTGEFSDWHLPTLDQLEILFLVKNEVNKALKDFNKTKTDPLNKEYWSSSRNYDDLMMGSNWIFDFNNGSRGFTNLPSVFVRAVRDF